MSVISTLRLSSVPRWGWAVIGVVAFGLLTDLVWTGAERWASRRRARRHTEATLTEVFFANERSSRPDDAGVPMDRFTSEHVQRIVDYLDRARISVCLGMYIVTVDSVGDALIRARNRGVRVRVIGCASMAYSSGSQMVKMAEEDIPIRFNDKGSAYLMHHKFCLIDTDWLCPRCYHAERVRRLGFCCDRPANGLPANGSVLPAGHAMASGSGGGLVANGGGRAAVVPCNLSDRGSGCAGCSRALRQEKERALMARGERDPLPVGGIIMTGSTNWTMQALSGNWDNIIVTSRPEVVVPFQVEFQRLWAVFARSRPMIERGAEAGAQQ